MTGILCAAVMGGVASGSDTQTVTIGGGNGAISIYTAYGFNTPGPYAGFGAISSGFFAPAGGLAIDALYGGQFGNPTPWTLVFTVTGAPNSGWSKMTLDGVDYLRTSASYGSGTWQWGTTSNPFGAASGTKDAVFT